ncbi:hypothetical protein Dimus_016394, partial [Dionaea muscipula]
EEAERGFDCVRRSEANERCRPSLCSVIPSTTRNNEERTTTPLSAATTCPIVKIPQATAAIIKRKAQQ